MTYNLEPQWASLTQHKHECFQNYRVTLSGFPHGETSCITMHSKLARGVSPFHTVCQKPWHFLSCGGLRTSSFAKWFILRPDTLWDRIGKEPYILEKNPRQMSEKHIWISQTSLFSLIVGFRGLRLSGPYQCTVIFDSPVVFHALFLFSVEIKGKQGGGNRKNYKFKWKWNI